MRVGTGSMLLSLISAVALMASGMSVYADENNAMDAGQDMSGMTNDSANGSGDVTQDVESKQVDNADDAESNDQGEPDMATDEDED